MAQIPGKYKLAENRNFYEFLVGVGVPEEKAKADNEIKGTINVSVDGNTIAIQNDAPDYTTNLVVGKEVEEKLKDFILLSTTQLDGNVLTITSKFGEHPAGTRTMAFSADGIEVTIAAERDGKSFKGTRIYKRI